jgi:hypothetical protein
MINWKYCLFLFLFIELIYRLIIYYNSRLVLEPVYITLINCPNEHIRLRCHLGMRPINFLMKFYDWYKILSRCRIIEYDFYFSNIIRIIDGILFITLLINIIC